MKTVLIAAAASLALVSAAPVLAQTTATEASADAQVCKSADTKAAWKAGNPSPNLADGTVEGQKAYCAGLKSATGHYAGATANRDNEGAVGAPSGTTGTQSPDVADTNSAAGMTTTMDPNAKPGE